MAMEFKSSRWILDLISWNGQDLGNGLAVKIRGQSDLRIYFWSAAQKKLLNLINLGKESSS